VASHARQQLVIIEFLFPMTDTNRSSSSEDIPMYASTRDSNWFAAPDSNWFTRNDSNWFTPKDSNWFTQPAAPQDSNW
jgi:hypothetical protein